MSSKEGLTRFYRDFQRICKQWPVDASKTGRDFGEHLRNSFDPKFKQGAFEELQAERTLNALMKISTNYYRNKYPRKREIAYSGENPDAYKDTLSSKYQSNVEPKKTLLERLLGAKKIAERGRDQ
ncbi:ubiquinol-cytochrome c reductase complex assembly factor 2-like [Clytia hemisphaerica]